MKALGFIETRGFVAAVEACDSALKAANVSLIGRKQPGSGLVAVIVTGDVAAVKAAVEAGAGSAASVGEVVTAQVIARPHEGLMVLFEEESAGKGGGAKKAAPAKAPAKKAADDKNTEKPGI